MAASLELGVEEFLHNSRSSSGVYESSRHHEYVGVVVLTNEMGYLGYPAESGAYALVLVECHGNTFTAAADANAGVALAVLYGFC
jgi:hypothetical protein